MKKSKLFAAALAAVLCVNILAACSSSESSEQTSESGSLPDGSSDTVESESDDSEAPQRSPLYSKLDPGTLTASFDRPSGFYSEEFDLTLTASDPEAEIFYTTDGSDPTPASNEYTGPIHIADRTPEKNVLAAHKDVSAGGDYIPTKRITKGTAIRAAAFIDGDKRGDVICGTYFVGIDREAEYLDVPVVSITIDEKYLFDYNIGIYTLGAIHDIWLDEDSNNKNLEGWQQEANYTQRGREWEREANIEYICADGSIGFSQDMGVRIMGAASRNEMQKSLRLIARDDYGKKNVKFEVIPDNLRSDGNGNVEKYKSFVLRNGGNDCNFAKIRDPLLQDLISDRDVETLQNTPCVAFINGEYWGMYTITEDYNDNYFQNNYEIDKDNVILIKRGKVEEGDDSDITNYQDAMKFICNNDMSDPENYAKACELLDMQSFADYCAFNLYINNEDSIFQDNNWRMWRARTPDESVPEADGRWRMAVYDVDYSTGIYGSSPKQANVSSAVKGSSAKDESPAKAFSSLCKNEEFLELFMTSIFDIRNVNFDKNRTHEALDEMAFYYKALVPPTYERFGPEWVLGWSSTSDKIRELRGYLDDRYDYFIYTISSKLGIGEKHNLSLSITGEDKGEVKINASGIPLWNGFEGVYPEISTITLHAEPKDGAIFKGWQAEGVTLDDPSAETVSFNMAGDVSITAVFE